MFAYFVAFDHNVVQSSTSSDLQRCRSLVVDLVKSNEGRDEPLDLVAIKVRVRHLIFKVHVTHTPLDRVAELRGGLSISGSAD